MGVASCRVDGNDAAACLLAARNARAYILQHRKPYFIEFMTYRVGDHSTSDNSSLYRKEE
jgi:2-oxoisovalerate dehydrogenase E1 component alpha subunit